MKKKFRETREGQVVNLAIHDMVHVTSIIMTQFKLWEKYIENGELIVDGVKVEKFTSGIDRMKKACTTAENIMDKLYIDMQEHVQDRNMLFEIESFIEDKKLVKAYLRDECTKEDLEKAGIKLGKPI